MQKNNIGMFNPLNDAITCWYFACELVGKSQLLCDYIHGL